MEVTAGSHVGVVLEVVGGHQPEHLGWGALDDLGRPEPHALPPIYPKFEAWMLTVCSRD
jgi:hypothetical protein